MIIVDSPVNTPFLVKVTHNGNVRIARQRKDTIHYTQMIMDPDTALRLADALVDTAEKANSFTP